MRKIGFYREPPTRYQAILDNRVKRKAMIEQAQGVSQATRSFMVNHINSVAAGRVQLSEMMLRNKVNKKV